MPTTDESGLRRTSTYFVPETETADGTPETPTDPAFNLWTKSINNEGGTSGTEFYESLGIGDAVAVDKTHATEEHERTINYDMFRFPVDPAGDGQSPLYYGATRNIDNQFHATLTHLKVVERDTIVANSTQHYRYFTEFGNTHPGTDPGASGGKASRQEIYGRGGRIDEIVPNANPSDAALITVEATMLFEKLRMYQIDQPDAEYIHVRSSDAGDTSITVDIETADGATSESLSTDGSDGTTVVASADTYDSLRVWVPDEFAGTIEIYGDDGSGTDAPGAPAELLTFIRGSDTYNGIDYDRGVPLVGSGSFETESALPAEGASALKSAGTWDGSAAAQKILGTEMSISNNTETVEPVGTFSPDIQPGQMEAELTCNVYGEMESTDKFADHIEGREGELRIPTTLGDIIFPRAFVSSGGEPEQEAGTSILEVEVVFRILQPTDGSDPIQFEHIDAP